MDAIMALALELLQTTRALQLQCAQGDLDSLPTLQAQRARLVAALDRESRQAYPREVLVNCRQLLEEVQQLEQEARQLLEQRKAETQQAFQQLKAADKARKAYDRFR